MTSVGDAHVVDPFPDGRVVRLEVRGISKRHRRRVVLDDVNLTVRAGEVAAIVGANGSGKSTLLKICAGMMSPDTGQVVVNGTVGYCPQEVAVLGFLRPDEHFVLFGAGREGNAGRSRQRGRSLVAGLGFNASEPTQARHLSGGTQQKLNLTLAVLGEPDLLLLDEPYQGFDRGTYIDFWNKVGAWRQAGKAVVVVTHMLNELDQVDLVLDLGDAAGTDARRQGAR